MSTAIGSLRRTLSRSPLGLGWMRAQTTLTRPLRVSGIGLHTGRHVDVILQPAEPDHGIVFYRSDVDTYIPALAEEAGRFDHATALGPKGRDVQTVEHLL